MAKLTVPDPLPSSFGYVPAPASAPSASESTPDWILPARQHESRFTEGDLNVLRDMGTPRVKALVAIIDGLRVSSSGGRGQPQKTDLG